MKKFLSKFIVFIGLIAATISTTGLLSSTPAFAEEKGLGGRDCPYLLGLTSWDCGFQEINSQDTLIKDIVIIASNVLTDLTVIAAYLILGYVIYGGYLYMFSTGDPGKAASGKKAITQAFIGLAIVVSAYTIFGAIRIALIGNASLGDCDPLDSSCVSADGGTLVTNLIQWVVGIAGVVAAAFIVVGGWGYMTSAGDPNKLQKAKSTILYALIGLVIVAFAEILTAFVSTLIREANSDATSYLDDRSLTTYQINKETT